MKTSEVLSDAKDCLATGWVREVMVSPAGYCMLGALDEALKQRRLDTEEHIEAWTSVKEILRQKIFEMFPHDVIHPCGDSFTCIAEFNDAPGRTRAEVFEVMEKAIAGCVERGE